MKTLILHGYGKILFFLVEKIENLGAVNRSLAIEREFFLCYLDNWSAMFSCNETEATVKSEF